MNPWDDFDWWEHVAAHLRADPGLRMVDGWTARGGRLDDIPYIDDIACDDGPTSFISPTDQ